MEAEQSGINFSKAISQDKTVIEKIGQEEIVKCLEPKNYTGHSSEIIDRVLSSIQ